MNQQSQDKIRKLKQQISDLENEIHILEQQEIPPYSTINSSRKQTDANPHAHENQKIPQHISPHIDKAQLFNRQFLPNNVSPNLKEKKNWEINFGKNILGILASMLVFIGIMLLAYATSSPLVQFISYIFTGFLFIFIGSFGESRKKQLRTAFLSVIGCGTGILYLGILLAYQYYHLFPVWITYTFFLLWSILVYVISRKKQTALFHGIGSVGMVVAIFSLKYIHTESFSFFSILFVFFYFITSVLFYHFTNIHTTSNFRLLPFYCNIISIQLLILQSISLSHAMQFPYQKLFFIGILLILGSVILLQYIDEMKIWHRTQKASDRIWLLFVIPTIIAFFYTIFSLHYLMENANIVISVFYSLGALTLVGFWIYSQKNRYITTSYRIVFLIICLTVFFLLQSAFYGIFAWILALIAIFLLGFFKRDGFTINFSYILFFGGTGNLLWKWISLWINELTFLLIYYIIFSILNAVLLRFSIRNTMISQIKITAICLQIFAMLFHWIFLIYPLSIPEKIILSTAVVILYGIMADCYLKKQSTSLSILFCFKYFFLIIWILCLFRVSFTFSSIVFCLLSIVYILLGLHDKNRTMTYIGVIFLFCFSFYVFISCLFFQNNFTIQAFSCAISYWIIYAAFHRAFVFSPKTQFPFFCRFLSLPGTIFVFIGINQLYELSLPIVVQLLFAPCIGIIVYLFGIWGIKRTQYQYAFIHATGCVLVQLFFSIILFYICFPSVNPIIISLFFLVWIGACCYILPKRSTYFFFLTYIGIILSCFFQTNFIFGKINTNTFTEILQNNLYLILYFTMASLTLLISVRKKINFPKRLSLFLLQGFEICLMLYLYTKQIYLVSEGILKDTDGIWILMQIIVYFIFIFLQYIFMCHCGNVINDQNTDLWYICYPIAIIQLFILSKCTLTTLRFQNIFLPDHPISSIVVNTGIIVLIMAFWYIAQLHKKTTISYWCNFFLTFGILLLYIFPLVYTNDKWGIIIWAFFLVSMVVAAKYKQTNTYLQIAYVLFLSVTFFFLLPFDILQTLSLRQLFVWMFCCFSICNILVFSTETFLLHKKTLIPICQGYNIFSMVSGSLLLLLRWTEKNPASFVYLHLYEKIMLTIILILVYILGTGRFFVVIESRMKAWKSQDTLPDPWQIGLKYTILVSLLCTCYHVPNFALSLFYFIFAGAFILFGFLQKKQNARVFGIILLIISICKMILLDINYERLILKAVSFIACGIVCFLIAFLYNFMEKRLIPKNIAKQTEKKQYIFK